MGARQLTPCAVVKPQIILFNMLPPPNQTHLLAGSGTREKLPRRLLWLCRAASRAIAACMPKSLPALLLLPQFKGEPTPSVSSNPLHPKDVLV
jgi:hypothetical protein